MEVVQVGHDRVPPSLHNVPEAVADHIGRYIKDWAESKELRAPDNEKEQARK